MKPFSRILVALLVSAAIAGAAYIYAPSFFPKFKTGSCIEDVTVHRIYRVLTVPNPWKGQFDAEIVASGTTVPGMNSVGTTQILFPDDQDLRPVECP